MEPQFPTIRSWQAMSERDQDALLDRIERARRRGLLWSRIGGWVALRAAAICVSGLLFDTGREMKKPHRRRRLIS